MHDVEAHHRDRGGPLRGLTRCAFPFALGVALCIGAGWFLVAGCAWILVTCYPILAITPFEWTLYSDGKLDLHTPIRLHHTRVAMVEVIGRYPAAKGGDSYEIRLRGRWSHLSLSRAAAQRLVGPLRAHDPDIRVHGASYF